MVFFVIEEIVVLTGEPGIQAPFAHHHRFRLVCVRGWAFRRVDYPSCTSTGVDDIVGADNKGHVRVLEVVVDLIHLHEEVVGDISLSQQHVHVPRHPASHRVNGVADGLPCR